MSLNQTTVFLSNKAFLIDRLFLFSENIKDDIKNDIKVIKTTPQSSRRVTT
jgi:hypothetical protein